MASANWSVSVSVSRYCASYSSYQSHLEYPMIDLSKYAEFVMAVTSKESREVEAFIARLKEVHYGSETLNGSLILTAMIGMTSEAGEAQEIIKKVLFQGKPFTDETRTHLKKELGDVIWYWINACNALQLDPNEVVAENVAKLEARYPGGKFDPFYSENRKEGDI
jgi:NTP pyrophosphatase (non-canonical NTP hydrolase)